MDIQVKYEDHNKLRFCEFDKCWVREMQMDGVWYCFYSRLKERLEEGAIEERLADLKNLRFADVVKQLKQALPKEYHGYAHICWEDFIPKSAGFIGNAKGSPPAYWKIMMIGPVKEDPHQPPPIQYNLVP